MVTRHPTNELHPFIAEKCATLASEIDGKFDDRMAMDSIKESIEEMLKRAHERGLPDYKINSILDSWIDNAPDRHTEYRRQKLALNALRNHVSLHLDKSIQKTWRKLLSLEYLKKSTEGMIREAYAKPYLLLVRRSVRDHCPESWRHAV